MQSRTIPGIERRAHPRLPLVRPAKVYDPRAHRYHAAQTCNLSPCGALLKVKRSMPIAAGDMLEVGIAREGQVVLEDEDMRPGRVVRVAPMDHFTQTVAVDFTASEGVTVWSRPMPVAEAYSRPPRQAA